MYTLFLWPFLIYIVYASLMKPSVISNFHCNIWWQFRPILWDQIHISLANSASDHTQNLLIQHHLTGAYYAWYRSAVSPNNNLSYHLLSTQHSHAARISNVPHHPYRCLDGLDVWLSVKRAGTAWTCPYGLKYWDICFWVAVRPCVVEEELSIISAKRTAANVQSRNINI